MREKIIPFCSNCGRELSDDEEICNTCGASKRTFTFEYQTARGDIITIMRNEERTAIYIDEGIASRNTPDTWKNIGSTAISEETHETVDPSTIDVFMIRNFRDPIRVCPICGRESYEISARHCGGCGAQLPD